jgi:phage terminase large subunit GpA-like protein
VDRLKPLIQTTPELSSRLDPKRDKDIEKYFAGVRLGLGWAGSATELSSVPNAEVHVDERDRMESDVQGEGAPDLTAFARAKNYRNSTVGIYSTPTLWGLSAIYSWWLRGTRKIWSLKCGDCSVVFPPLLDVLSFDEALTPAEIRRTAVIACPACGSVIRNEHRKDLTYGYKSYDADDEGVYTPRDESPDSSIESCWVPGLMSMFVHLGELAERLAIARLSGSPHEEQAVVNTDFGQPYRMQGDAPDFQVVLSHCGEYKRGEVVNSIQRLVLGVDVQGDRLPWTLRGFGVGLESWAVDYGELIGDTDRTYVWETLREVLWATYGSLSIDICLIDSGYRPGMKSARPEHAVYKFCRDHQNAFPTKGKNVLEKPVRPSQINYDKGKFALKQRLYIINTHYFKTWVYSRLRRDTTESGAWWVPADTSKSYAKGVVSESLIQGANPVWIVNNPENHPLDCEVLCAAGAHIRNYSEKIRAKGVGQLKKRTIKRDPSMQRRGI